MNWVTVAIAFSVFSIALCGNDIDPDFLAWMNANLTPDEVAQIVRDDLVTGSFGGGVYTGNSNDRPVVLVHGLTNEAGNFWKIRQDFVAASYPKQRIFASSWGRGNEAFNTNVKLECAYVQAVRRFIEVVLAYTGAPQINVAGYSLGSPLARKAILGGTCVDNSTVNFGAPLTSKIHTYLSVAGANQGSYLCLLPIVPVCSTTIGLSCGSKFLKDINTPSNYEATNNKFSIASESDEVVGYYACLKKASMFTGAEETVVTGMSHTETEYDTASIQLPLLRQN